MGGHLATITSGEEFNAVEKLMNDYIWRTSGNARAPWIGLHEADNDDVPGLEWNWVTGETWDESMSNWYPGLTTLNPGGDDGVYLMHNLFFYPYNKGKTVGAFIVEYPLDSKNCDSIFQ